MSFTERGARDRVYQRMDVRASSEDRDQRAGIGGRRRNVGRALGLFVAGIVGLLLLALLGVWLARKPIADNVIARELARRGVRATYHLDRIGLRTQRISNLVIGDPARPDLVAKSAQVEMRIKLNGGVEVFRIVARGVRLRGRVVGNRVSWGEVDKLLPAPKSVATPFKLCTCKTHFASSRAA